MKHIDLTGKIFGRLKVLGRDSNRGKKVMWKCQCQCGNISFVATCNLNNGKAKSCGCLRAETSRLRNTTHNLSNTHLYGVWIALKKRCNNPKDTYYKDYGGRGIKVCKEWQHSFLPFYEWSIKSGYCKGLSIDRIDNNGNYCPENCRWVDNYVQANNTRVNRYITIGDETKTLTQWCRYYSTSRQTFYRRMKKGFTEIEALTTPAKGHPTSNPFV